MERIEKRKNNELMKLETKRKLTDEMKENSKGRKPQDNSAGTNQRKSMQINENQKRKTSPNKKQRKAREGRDEMKFKTKIAV